MLVTAESLRARYASAPTPELLQVVTTPRAFTSEAIAIAVEILRERGVDLPATVMDAPPLADHAFVRAARSLAAAFLLSVLLVAILLSSFALAGEAIRHHPLLIAAVWTAWWAILTGVPLAFCIGLPLRHVQRATAKVQSIVVLVGVVVAAVAAYAGTLLAWFVIAMAERH